MHRVDIQFSDEAYDALLQIATSLGASKSEALRRSLGLMRFVLEEIADSNKILVIEDTKTGERQRLIRY